MIDVERRDDVRVLRWHDGENRVNPDSVAAWNAVLDGLEAVDGPLAVVAVGEGRFFSNGLDLDRFALAPDELGPSIEGLHRLLGRLLVFPAYTVAAVNGHAFAAGAMLSAVFDRRLMREGRGYWCLPEVDLGMALTEQMTAAVTARLPLPAVGDAMLTGRRFGASAALAAGLVDGTAPEDELVDRAVEVAAVVAGKDRGVIATHKRQMFGAAAASCGWPG